MSQPSSVLCYRCNRFYSSDTCHLKDDIATNYKKDFKREKKIMDSLAIYIVIFVTAAVALIALGFALYEYITRTPSSNTKTEVIAVADLEMETGTAASFTVNSATMTTTETSSHLHLKVTLTDVASELVAGFGNHLKFKWTRPESLWGKTIIGSSAATQWFGDQGQVPISLLLENALSIPTNFQDRLTLITSAPVGGGGPTISVRCDISMVFDR
jgi:hypothetical protein